AQDDATWHVGLARLWRRQRRDRARARCGARRWRGALGRMRQVHTAIVRAHALSPAAARALGLLESAAEDDAAEPRATPKRKSARRGSETAELASRTAARALAQFCDAERAHGRVGVCLGVHFARAELIERAAEQAERLGLTDYCDPHAF